MTKIVDAQCRDLSPLLLATSPAHAGPCAQTIASVQAQVDAAIENAPARMAGSRKASTHCAAISRRPARWQPPRAAMASFSSMRLTRSTAPAQRIAPPTPPHATRNSPMRERRCANSANAAAARSGNPHRASRQQYVHSGNTGAPAALILSDREQPGRSTADAGTARFETPQCATAQITRDRVDGPVRVIDGWHLSSGRAGPAIAQAISSDMQPAVGMGTTSPLAAAIGSRRQAFRSVRPKLRHPASVRSSPSQSAGMTTCAGSDDAGPSGSPVRRRRDLGKRTSLSCADSQPISSPLPSPSSIGRVGIPLGATELGGAGISPAAPATSPDLSNSANPTTTPGNP